MVMSLAQLAHLLGKAVKASTLFQKAKCGRAWRDTRVVLAALQSSQDPMILERQAEVAELLLPHQSTFALA